MREGEEVRELLKASLEKIKKNEDFLQCLVSRLL